MTTTKEKIEIMQAYLDGKIIQVKNELDKTWEDWPLQKEPFWEWKQNSYRIKVIPREFWLLYVENTGTVYCFESEEEAKNKRNITPNYKEIVHVREVL